MRRGEIMIGTTNISKQVQALKGDSE